MEEDLGIKIGSDEQVAWTTIRDGAKKEVEQNKRAIIIGLGIIKTAEDMIAKEEGLNSCEDVE
jgi:hypothetical protein